MSRIYVASACEDMQRARSVMTALRARGHEITFDWTPHVEAFGSGGGPRRQNAERDLDGVRRAEVVLVLAPAEKHVGCGMWIELGAALALAKRAVITGVLRDRTIFSDLAEARFATDEEAIEYLA